MWTYNSARTLEMSLPSIDRASSKGNICHKIAVDGGSEDSTQAELRSHGWLVLEAPKKGIPYQANYALKQVDTEFFAAFEHDIILNPNWFEKTSRLIASDETIGAVQGVRLYSGSKTMRAIEEWRYRENRLPVWAFSIDNTLLRTEAVKLAGGFSDEDMASADTILRKDLFELGYKWITDPTLISGHYRKDFLEQFRHQLGSLELAKYYWNKPERSILSRVLSILGGNPINVLRMTTQSRMLRVPLAWYILRLEIALYQNIPHQGKFMKPVPMDEWHLDRFAHTILESGKELQTANGKLDLHSVPRDNCAWCGQPARLTYKIPTDWGNIRPRLFSPTGRGFLACSQDHARRIAERVFTNAFDYVTPLERIKGKLAS